MFRTGVDEVHEPSTAIKLGKKHSSISLRFRALDPLQTWSDTAILTAAFPKNPASIAAHPHFLVLLLFRINQICFELIVIEGGKKDENIREDDLRKCML